MANSSQQTTVIELPHNLTNDEKLEQQNKVMKLLDTKQDLAAELVSINLRHKRDKTENEKKVGEVEAEINKVRGEIKVGVEMRKYRCNVFRDRDTRKVEYSVIDGPLAGQVVKTEDFTQDDWNAILEDSEPELPFPDNDDEQPDLRAQADLTAEPALGPDKDENDRVVAGPNTDAYNLANPGDETYQHLSEHIDFTPAVTSVQQADADAGAEPTDAADVDRDDEHDLGTPHTDTPDDSDEDDEDDEPSDDDEPQPDPKPAPKPRKAKRIEPKK